MDAQVSLNQSRAEDITLEEDYGHLSLGDDGFGIPSPTPLKSLVCDVKYPYGNYLIHQLVLNNSKPSDSCRESDIRAALRSFPAAQVNRRNEDGFTALHLAVIKRNSFMVKMLLSCLPTLDVDAKCVDKANGGTALHLAASTNYFDSPHLNAGSNYGKTTLDKDDNEDCLEMVKVLVESGASVNECDNIGETPLHIAARYDLIDVLELLISRGAALNAKNNRGRTALHGSESCVCLLHDTVCKGCFETVKFLVESGASVNECDIDFATPLHVAARYGLIDILELLISKGAALNDKDIWGKTALYSAVLHKRYEIVKVLVESGASVNECANDGGTPLHVAYNQIHVLKLLISKGAAMNVKNIRGRTPLYEVVRYGNFETVKVLVESGASVNECDNDDATPLHFAVRRNRIDILELLIRRGAALNAQDRMGRTPLHEAARCRHLETVKVLVERGASVNECDKDGNTAFDFAAHDIEIVAYLNCRFANVDAVGRDDGVLVPERVCINTAKLGEPPFKKMRRN